jgi:ferrous iron transport protein B
MNVPVVIILNMMDEVKRRNMDVDIKKLGDILGTKIISTGSNDRSELKKIKHIVDEDNKSTFERFSYFSKDITEAVDDISKAVSKSDLESGIDAKWLALKILEKDQEVLSALKDIDEGLLKKGEELKKELEAKYNEDITHLLAKQRYAFLSLTAKKVIKDTEGNLERETLTEKLDKYLTHRILSIPIFLGIMWLIYYITITGLGDMTIGFMEWLIGDFITGAAESGLAWIGASEMVESLVVDGIIGGVGAVLVFVPQIMILFFFISILEDSGYMARIAFMMDRVFKKFGLSGKSIIPMLVGSGCSVPGIMATRTLENERDRKLTIILTPFISCGAKMPVYLLFASAFFASSAHWVVFSLYVLGIGIAMASGMLLSKLRYKGEESGFLLELPPYRIPALKSVAIHMWDKGKDFLIRAGTVIFAASVILWFAQSFDFSFSHVADPSLSILALFGKAIAPVFIPLGFGDWITSVAFITGFAAKEIVISTLSVLHGVGEGALVTSLRGLYTPLSAYSFMVFILLASPCFAAISVMKKELNSWKETGFAVLYQTGTAYLMAMAVYQIGSLFF